MIELDRALDIVRNVPPDSRVETVLLSDALHRVLARDVASPMDSPPFDKSAMDGFAIAAGDESSEYKILETVAAGRLPGQAVRRGECARIMTGAMLPPGTDRVIRREFVEESQGRIRILMAETGDNVIRRGSSLRAGMTVLRPKALGPQDIGILAASGIGEIMAAVPPATGILCTGPEIRAPGESLEPGQIYDSNGPQLRAQLAGLRCPCRQHPPVEDRPGPLASAIESALRTCDLLLLTGGVSAGDFDYVPRCLEEMGAEILFHGVAVKPGKPTLFARRDDVFIFGLPGNPVSAFVIFEVLVKPFLYRRMGIDWSPPLYHGTLAHAFRRPHSERTEFLPVKVRQGRVEVVPYHGSAHLNSLGEADGLIRIEKDVREIAQGEGIDVRPL